MTPKGSRDKEQIMEEIIEYVEAVEATALSEMTAIAVEVAMTMTR